MFKYIIHHVYHLFLCLFMFIVRNGGHAPVRLFFTMAEGDTASRPQLWYSFKTPSGKHW